jgi:hypothetical protein
MPRECRTRGARNSRLARRAVQRADRLPEDRRDRRDVQVRSWEDAWLAAHLAIYGIHRRRRGDAPW